MLLTAGTAWAREEAAASARPRLIGPLSTSRVISPRPLLRWSLGAKTTGAMIEICRDRACAQQVERFFAAGTSVRPAALPAGVYFWRALGSVGDGPVSEPSAIWEFEVRASAAADSAPATGTNGGIFDVNGDGAADFAIGQPNSLGGSTFVYHGGTSGLSKVPATTLLGPPNAGNTVANVGDVNGDGYAELAVASVSNATSVIVYPGGPNGLQSEGTPLDPGGALLFGGTIASAGDVNGDGYGDVIVGTRYGALLYLGSASGITPTHARILSGPGSAGSAVTGGDYNGDGFGDIVVASPNQGACVYSGSANGLEAGAALCTSGGAYALASGDFNGDGYGDLAIRSGAGITVRLGGASGLSASARSVPGPQGWLATADVNGDGCSDLIASDFNANVVSVFPGGPSGIATSPGFTLTGPAGGRFGDGLATGDANRDGFDELMVGAPAAGQASVYTGSAAGLGAAPALTLTVEYRFGQSIAMRELPR